MKNNVDKQYLNYLKYILDNGVEKRDRTGTGTISIFDYSMRFKMSEGFPLLTSKKVFTKAVIHELIWFLRGDTNIKYLVDNGVNIWNGDAYKNYVNKVSLSSSGKWCKVVNDENGNHPDLYTMDEFIDKIKTDDDFSKQWGELGPVYGKQWRSWGGFEQEPSGWHHGTPTNYKSVAKNDQISDLIYRLKNDPDSRRLMVSAWNVDDLPKMALPPCHFGFQCYTSELSTKKRIKWWCDSLGKHISYGDDLDKKRLDELGVPKRKLDLKWFQRSVDSFLGLPFNIASYAILLHLLAKEVNMVPGDLIFNGGDCHIYLNHINQCKTQMNQKTFSLPKIELHNSSIFNLVYEDIKIIGYESSPSIKGSLSN
jgi:thymidylate synthase